MNFAYCLTRHRDEIIDKWVERLHKDVGPRYSALPKKALYQSITRATDANYAFLCENDLSKINAFIEWISKARLKIGFSLSDVQKAFELYRIVLLPILERELPPEDFKAAVRQLNDCLAYTIYKFSDYYQALHEAQLTNYTQTLELMVEKRTKQLAESEYKYRTLVEKIRDGYFVTQNGRITFANKAFCDMHGYKKREIVGRDCAELVAPQSFEEVKSFYENRVKKDGVRYQYAYLRRHKDGRALPTENSVSRAIYQGKTALIGICRDITERVEMERRVREAESLAHIGHLTTSLVHEIRNPLSSAKMSIQMILKNISFEGINRRRLEILSEQIARLERIVAEMLDFAKPLRLELSSTSINSLIDESLEIIEAKIKERDIKVVKSISPSLPTITIAKEKMEQAIINLLLNSIEVLDAGGTITIDARYCSEKRLIKLTFSDNGPGVSEEDLPYIFNPYFTKKPKGTGLGLTNVKRIIEAHKGSIQASVGKNGGMSFCITLPLHISHIHKERKGAA